MAKLDISADKTNINKNDTVTFTVTNTLTSITNVFIGNTVIDSDSTSTHTFTYTFTAIGEYTVVLKEFNKIYDSWITIKSIVITVSEPPTGSWSIGNKTVQSLTIGNKEIQTIERVSDGAIIYQRPPVYAISLVSDKTTAETGETVTFTATLTLDNQAVSGETVTFTDGTNTLGTSTTNSNGVATLTYSWNNTDEYSIKVIYKNAESNSVNIVIVPLFLTVTFTGNEFAPSSTISSKGVIGSNLIIDWGDGTTQSLTSNKKLPTHTYSTSGTYTIQITGNVNSTGAYCFKGYTGITSVGIPKSITSLGDYSFDGCTNLTKIIIPNSVTSIGSRCFGSCTHLTKVTIPNSITSISNNCFEGCTNLTSVSIPNTITKIGNSSFSTCTNLTNITIPNSVTSIGSTCFLRCSSLTNITIPNSVTSIGSMCFYNCTKLIDYQLYWSDPPVTWSASLMPNNTNTYYTIPHGSTANYIAKSFPSAKLIERSA